MSVRAAQFERDRANSFAPEWGGVNLASFSMTMRSADEAIASFSDGARIWDNGEWGASEQRSKIVTKSREYWIIGLPGSRGESAIVLYPELFPEG
jgi:hypothetical protein